MAVSRKLLWPPRTYTTARCLAGGEWRDPPIAHNEECGSKRRNLAASLRGHSDSRLTLRRCLTRPRVNQACALRVESELRVCLHGLGCWARARALARTFSSTSSSTTFDEAKGGGHRVGRSPPHARNTHTPTPACTVYPHARACLNHPPRRCTPFLPAHAPNPIPHLHSPKP